MYKKVDLKGPWYLQLDPDKKGFSLPFKDTIDLPSTTSYSKKGNRNEAIEISHLTDEYKFHGHAWFQKEVELSEDEAKLNCFLYLERTRMTTVWVNHHEVGSQNSLSTPHIYDISGCLLSGKNMITICVDNTNYPTKGGHLTSPDTQTNWNGITGRLELQFYHKIHLSPDIVVYPSVLDKCFNIQTELNGCSEASLRVSAQSFNGPCEQFLEKDFLLTKGKNNIIFTLGEDALLWSEYEQNLYKLIFKLMVNGIETDQNEIICGLRDFQTNGDKFMINGRKTFLRGKHDGLIFPKTGFAPTSVEEWIRVLSISKSYGINHYRFHTACPPEAAFIAADRLGIYMEPEIPFWGTITSKEDEYHNQEEQDYLINEGFLILKHFGNHPSFVMMSLGNELWGSKDILNSILKQYKSYDHRHLYTQGCNNFMWYPTILEQDDFFCGVRLGKERMIRGSFAMCDAPLGHVQTDYPNTMKDYDESIVPKEVYEDKQLNETIDIQYGTGTKKIEMNDTNKELIPNVPVIAHEIGQYTIYPNFNERSKYTGSLKAKYLEVFKNRLEDKGLGHLGNKYFECSGKLAISCYKEELEALFRSKKIAAFHLLDLQDFVGQGVALVGVLDAFMDSKGLISDKKWRSFCSDAVLLARFPKYNYIANEDFKAHIELAYFRPNLLKSPTLHWELRGGDKVYRSGDIRVDGNFDVPYIEIGDLSFKIPTSNQMMKVTLDLKILSTDIEKTYDLWIYPEHLFIDTKGLHIHHELTNQVISLLEQGENVLFFPKLDTLTNSIKGFYASDFWCYPMFRSISENMNKEIPIGTMGLLIDHKHPIFKDFYTEMHSTYQWFSIVENSRSVILDDTKHSFLPIVQTIDNFERNHKLGLLFESKVLNGNLLVCCCDAKEIMKYPEGKQFIFSIFHYVKSKNFKPKHTLAIHELKNLLR